MPCKHIAKGQLFRDFLFAVAFYTHSPCVAACPPGHWKLLGDRIVCFHLLFSSSSKDKIDRFSANGVFMNEWVNLLCLRSPIAFSTGIDNVNSIMDEELQFKVTFYFLNCHNILITWRKIRWDLPFHRTWMPGPWKELTYNNYLLKI